MAPNHSDFARRKFLPGSRGNPRKWGPGKGEYERGALILSRPRRRFGSFAAVGKGTRRPQAAKSPCEERNRSIIAPSSAPVCALGHLPPRGKACRRLMAAPAANQHQCRWLGKLRRIHRAAPVLIFLPLRPPVGPDGMAPNHSDFSRRKILAWFKGELP